MPTTTNDGHARRARELQRAIEKIEELEEANKHLRDTIRRIADENHGLRRTISMERQAA